MADLDRVAVGVPDRGPAAGVAAVAPVAVWVGAQVRAPESVSALGQDSAGPDAPSGSPCLPVLVLDLTRLSLSNTPARSPYADRAGPKSICTSISITCADQPS